MTILALHRHHPKKAALSGFLVALFLVQSLLLPWLTAPQIEQTTPGQWAVMCTLQGLQRVYIKPGHPAPVSKQNHCPACTLAHVLHVPVPTVNLPLLLSQWRYSNRVVSEEHVVTVRLDHGGHAIRAPPVA